MAPIYLRKGEQNRKISFHFNGDRVFMRRLTLEITTLLLSLSQQRWIDLILMCFVIDFLNQTNYMQSSISI